MLCYVIDDAFPSPVSSGPHRTKAGLSTPKIRSPKVRFNELSDKTFNPPWWKVFFLISLAKNEAFLFEVWRFIGD